MNDAKDGSPRISITEEWIRFDEICLDPLINARQRILVEQGFFSAAHIILQLVAMMDEKCMSHDEIMQVVEGMKAETEQHLQKWAPKPENS